MSTLVCLPASLSQEVGADLAQAVKPACVRLAAGELSRSRRAAETPFNLVLEVGP